MTQLSLLPVRLRDEFEADRSKSKDLLWTGFDEQDRRYALKTCEADNPALPLTEWVCYHLCLLCAIPTPDFAILTRKDGSLAFGSRWEDDVDQFVRDETTPAELGLWFDSTRDDVSAIFALDCFLPNSDRHIGNLLFRRGPRRRALAFDWSRTTLFEPWPLAADCATSQNLDWLKRSGLFSPSAWTGALEKLREITHTEVRNIMDAAPNEWCTHLSKDILQDWWQHNHIDRIDALK